MIETMHFLPLSPVLQVEAIAYLKKWSIFLIVDGKNDLCCMNMGSKLISGILLV